MPISVLPNHVVDQIAAGEVIERPAQMLKELIENSLDAGANQLSIEFSRGGRDILLTDDGNGISKDELALAVARHATSKMQDIHDLWTLSSYGFRGEALASIAAVSQMRILSSTEGPQAHEIKIHFGSLEKVRESRSERGTTIEVKDLFENIPARLKFLKSESSESTHIKNLVKAMALARPDATWNLKQNGELLYMWPKTESYLLRAKNVLGESELYENRTQDGGYSCEVVLSSPNVTAKNSKQIHIYVNGRWIQDRTILAAVMDAYRSLLMHGEYPLACLFLQVPPDELDVNVSPTKSQVKFRNSSLVFRIVHRACRELLEKAPWMDAFFHKQHQDTAQKEVPTQSLENLLFQDQTLQRTQYLRKTEMSFDLPFVKSAMASSELVTPATKQDFVPVSAGSWTALNLIGQAHLTYILAEKADGLVIIDQHAAHERVLYEKLMHSVQTGSLEVQSYLFPITVVVSEEEMDALQNLKKDLLTYGLEIESMGPQTVAINAAPAMMKEESLVQAIKKLAQECVELGGSFEFEKYVRSLVATMACHSAIRAGQSLSFAEMSALVAEMDQYTLSSFCPHGRPVFVDYPTAKLEKDFGRIV